MDRLRPDNFSTLKGYVLHRARAHLKIPGYSRVWNALLTKNLPMFLSRLNEINGGCETILPVSGSELATFVISAIKHGGQLRMNFFIHFEDITLSPGLLKGGEFSNDCRRNWTKNPFKNS